MIGTIIAIVAGLTAVSSAVAAISDSTSSSEEENRLKITTIDEDNVSEAISFSNRIYTDIPVISNISNTTISEEYISERDVPSEFVKRVNKRKSGILGKISNWMQSVYDHIQNVIGRVVDGVKVFLKETGGCFKAYADYYSMYSQDNQYIKTTAWSEDVIEENEVPQKFLDRYYHSMENDMDISSELELQISS
ncbi:MAG: hypothetical protein K2G88_01185 [Oscillospiraceae bacterium]|nr:hypothetical protein [Oscillospiraceae bacterium]